MSPAEIRHRHRRRARRRLRRRNSSRRHRERMLIEIRPAQSPQCRVFQPIRCLLKQFRDGMLFRNWNWKTCRQVRQRRYCRTFLSIVFSLSFSPKHSLKIRKWRFSSKLHCSEIKFCWMIKHFKKTFISQFWRKVFITYLKKLAKSHEHGQISRHFNSWVSRTTR